MLERLKKLLWIPLVAVFLASCGGGGGSSSSSGGGGASAPQTFQITWPARSKGITTPLSSALSVHIVFKGAAQSGADIPVDIDRDTNQIGQYTGTYAISGAVKSATVPMTATFYAAAKEQGAIVGTATAMVNPSAANASFTNLQVVGVISQVAVQSTSISVKGNPAQLISTAMDASSNPVAISPGSAVWSISSGATISLTRDGLATPLSLGKTVVACSIDGVIGKGDITIVSAGLSNPQFAISWPARSRSINNPLTSALSAHVVFVGGNISGGGDLVVNVDRDPNESGAYTGQYSVNGSIQGAPVPVQATFYAAAAQQGAVVGTASGMTSVSSTLDIVQVVVSGTITQVTVPSVTVYLTDAPSQLQFSASDASNNPVAVSPGSATWSISSGSSISVSKDGVETPRSAGPTTVSATIDGVSGSGVVTVSSVGGKPQWAMAGHDAQQTYRGDGSGAGGKLKWVYNANNDIYLGTPSIGADGTIYVGVGGGIRAVNPDGTLKWFYNTGIQAPGTPAIANDGTIYYCDQTNTYAINPDGSLKWSTAAGLLGINPINGILIDSSGSLYELEPGDATSTSQSFLRKVSSSGIVQWTHNFQTGYFGLNPALGADESTVYTGALNNATAFTGYAGSSLIALQTSDGSQAWSQPQVVLGDLKVLADGSLIMRNVGTQNGEYTQSTDQSGNLRWLSTVPCHGSAIRNDGSIWAFQGSNLYTLNPSNGASVLSASGAFISQQIATDANGVAYIAGESRLFAFDRNGNKLWEFLMPVSGGGVGGPAIAKDGTVYVTTGGQLVAIK